MRVDDYIVATLGDRMMTIRDLSREIGYSEIAIRQALRRLRLAGEVEKKYMLAKTSRGGRMYVWFRTYEESTDE